MLDDLDLHALSPVAYRAQIGVVPQHVLLFNGSVADNIAYGQPGATPEAIMAAARAAQAHDFVTRLPQGYDSLIGDQGIRLEVEARVCARSTKAGDSIAARRASSFKSTFRKLARISGSSTSETLSDMLTM